MKKNRIIAFLSLFLLFQVLSAQDLLPLLPVLERENGAVVPLKELLKIDSVFITVTLPEPFKEVKENCIIDEDRALNGVLEQLRLLRAGALKDSIRILHIGDSHVRGHIYPQTTGERLKEEFGAMIYTDMGVNGATCLTFTHPLRIEAIVEQNPDLLILSFGTNESHNRRYNKNVHYNQIDELVKLIRSKLPNTPILLTTPPGAYESFRRKNRRRTYSINPRTKGAVENIVHYARTHKLAVWDMYNAVGGAERACKNWKEAGLMRPDHIHYLPEGYVLQGELLNEAIIKLYNTYVSD